MANDAAAVWVLIVDDHEMVRGLCEEVILTLGHRALMADSAIRALEIIEQQQVDIVIADIKMSGMSGIELLEQIKTTNPQIEVVIMTGYATVPSAVQAMKLGATDYITKPFSAEEFRLVVERLVQTLELKEENRCLREQLRSRSSLGAIFDARVGAACLSPPHAPSRTRRGSVPSVAMSARLACCAVLSWAPPMDNRARMRT